MLWFCLWVSQYIFQDEGDQFDQFVIEKKPTLNKNSNLVENTNTMLVSYKDRSILYICLGHFGNVSKANRPAYLCTEECSLSVTLVFLSEFETGRKKRSYILLRNPALII